MRFLVEESFWSLYKKLAGYSPFLITEYTSGYQACHIWYLSGRIPSMKKAGLSGQISGFLVHL